MNRNNTNKCDNCGAGLKPVNQQLKCPYCGSIFPSNPQEEKPLVVEPILIEPQPVYADTQTDKLTGNNGGCFIIMIAFLGIVAVILLIISHNNNSDYNSSYADSTAVDTTIIDTAKLVIIDEKEEALKEKLAELTSITVTKATFKSLYKNTRKHYDEFSKTTFIYDNSSPQHLNYNGVFIYITKIGDDLELWFKMQYVSDEWLYINRAIFNLDGKNQDYGWDFRQGSSNNESWEWFAINFTNMPSSMIEIARAKKAKVKYSGKNLYDIVIITKKQQAAMKRQLQVYKGLLLGYNK